MYFFPFEEVGKGPMISQDIFSNGGVALIVASGACGLGCGDFKVTLNSVSKLDRHLIPRIEDLFATLGGGTLFSKLDMSQAYQQLELDEVSQQYTVINTHKGLFRYRRLPFGIVSAPTIFQRVMESLLQNILGVIMYIDDVLITGKNDEEHLKSLETVLK